MVALSLQSVIFSPFIEPFKFLLKAGQKKGRGFQKNIYFCFIDCMKTFDCEDHIKLWKIHKGMGIPDHLIYLLRNLYWVKKQQLELIGSELGKEYIKAVYCHSAYLTSVRSES